ncbi:ATP-dependent helicase [Acidithiobacillus sp.]|uniref:ATP-dependent helicase n=1 Tax=Acidithiobacillus sp. TaxID=1872118 RepID=UPI0026203CA4|nr:ATP-dependent helicase [Acidithiobacillus sp.]MDD5278687.1 ATP-dependent helicase [Acidithiobacillus sp.]
MLTPEQKKASEHTDGNALIIAGPGSGKSTTLRHLAANHLRNGITRPEDMLIVMFSEKATRDFAAKMQPICPTKMPAISTLHAAAYRFLRAIYRAGMDAPKTLKVEDFYWDQLAASAIARVNQIRVEDVEAQAIEQARKEIGILKANLIKPDMVNREIAAQMDMEDLQTSKAVYAQYEKTRKEEGTISFDDMIYDLLNVYFNDKNAQSILKKTYKTVLVDEFQDMNRANMEFIRIIAKNVIAIGDDDQSIFGFRGSSPYYMTQQFNQIFHDVTSYKITETFRYGKTLSQVAGTLITHNSDRIEKEIVTAKGVQDTAVFLRFTDTPGDTALSFIQEGLHTPGNIGILVRTFHQSALCEIALTEAGIPYILEGGAPAFDRRDTLSTIGYLAASINRLGDMTLFHDRDRLRKAVRAMLTTPNRFIRKEDLNAAEDAVVEGTNLESWLKTKMDNLINGEGSYAQRLYATLDNLLGHIHFLKGIAREGDCSASSMIRTIYGRLGLHDYIRHSGPADRANDRTAFYAVMSDYASANNLSIEQFIGNVETLARKSRGSGLSPKRTARIHITSWHGSKGREFGTVILPDLVDGKVPYIRTDKEYPDIEEERRLFYVAMTRARQRLILLSPHDAQLEAIIRKQKTASKNNPAKKASRFLYEIAYCPGITVDAEQLTRQAS